MRIMVIIIIPFIIHPFGSRQKHLTSDVKRDSDGLPNIDAFWEAFDDENGKDKI
jgi:hypothetical protein